MASDEVDRLRGVSKTWGDVLACFGLIGLAGT